MKDQNQRIFFREMVLDLHYRLRMADELFCEAAESFVASVAFDEWENRRKVIGNIREYARALQIIDADFSRIVTGRQVVFPAELGEWIYDFADGESKVQSHLERLRAIADGLEMAVDRELLRMELSDE